MRTLWTILEGRRGEFLRLLAASSLVSAAEALLHPLMLKWLFDEAVAAQDFRRFGLLGLAYLAAGLALIGLFWAVSLWQKAFVNRVVLEVEGRLLAKALRLDWRDFSREGAGAFVSRVHQDALEGLAPAVSLLVAVARQGLAALAFLGVLLYLSWQATLALAMLVPPLLWVARRVGTKVRRAAEDEREGEARYLEVLSQSLKAFRALRGLPRLGPPTLAANREALGAYLDGTYRSHRLMEAQQAWSDGFMNLANTLALVVGGYFVLARALSFGGYLAFVNAFWRAVDNTFALLRRVPELHRHAQVLERVHGLLSSAPAPYARPAAEARLEGVRLAYAGGAPLELPRLEVRPGERLLLLGPNGAGKTTLLHVLSGYLAPERGEVELPARVAALTAPPSCHPWRCASWSPTPGSGGSWASRAWTTASPRPCPRGSGRGPPSGRCCARRPTSTCWASPWPTWTPRAARGCSSWSCAGPRGRPWWWCCTGTRRCTAASTGWWSWRAGGRRAPGSGRAAGNSAAPSGSGLREAPAGPAVSSAWPCPARRLNGGREGRGRGARAGKPAGRSASGRAPGGAAPAGSAPGGRRASAAGGRGGS
ncbi:Toxin RTX-I translocation ATP-binding protein [Calidithermus terrae]|uniref:Toxin RTX-I translocation ATP-binding protein n=1 Tax=Calidithermus terrae TaxID=1408545 RepID=A0A399EJG4_9DEIN|nr:ABC transporter ATP-binding protein [Calidithermus terrae]RIH83440.1 Toxin RTX-I translocation ATP-binding protein [Calidithermus terrae]